MPVYVTGWGGEDLRGRVRLVEPSGFTKVSALGVEEQRVDIIIDPDGDPDRWTRIGDRFRVELRIELWTSDDVLTVPTGAVFKADGAEAVFVVENGTAQVRQVRVGRRTGLQAQVLGGLNEGEMVVLYPSDLIESGTRVQIR
jgi:HlyD family secretion protein